MKSVAIERINLIITNQKQFDGIVCTDINGLSANTHFWRICTESIVIHNKIEAHIRKIFTGYNSQRL